MGFSQFLSAPFLNIVVNGCAVREKYFRKRRYTLKAPKKDFRIDLSD